MILTSSYSAWIYLQNCVRVYDLIKRIFSYLRICDALHDLVPFVEFKPHEKRPWRSVNFTLIKVTPLPAPHPDVFWYRWKGMGS